MVGAAAKCLGLPAEGRSIATQDDALLVVQLLRWWSEVGAEEAAQTISAANFDIEMASADDPPPAKLPTFGEAVATLVKNGLLNEALSHNI